ncbi:hypothetical protein BC940DRAFT_320467 [Gongronella butleri]|nr:hypothetical protein BC940DRAFT_320467 [Gongronella butleri]
MRRVRLWLVAAIVVALFLLLQVVEAKKDKKYDKEEEDDEDMSDAERNATPPPNGIPVGEEIKTPRDAEWLKSVDMSKVPNSPRRQVGSGVCRNAKCDGSDNDRCFESCGNKPDHDDVYGCKSKGQWALTFDDGPSLFTQDLLDILDKENVKATFCVMGAHVKLFPEFVKRAHASGHVIASHTYSHPHLMSLSNEEIVYEMRATDDAIHAVTGIRPKYMRPPFGEADQRVKGLLKSMGYKILMWNVDPKDYEVFAEPKAAEMIQKTIDEAIHQNMTVTNPHDDPGYISLQHDLYQVSIQQVPMFIKKLRDKGYKITTASECVNDNQPHYDGHFMNGDLPAQVSRQTNTGSGSGAATGTGTGPDSRIDAVGGDATAKSDAPFSYSTSVYLFSLLITMPLVTAALF